MFNVVAGAFRDQAAGVDELEIRQKVPCLGDRRFLINQAILSSSVPSNRVAFINVSKPGRNVSAASTDANARTQAGAASGHGKRGPLTSNGSTSSFQRFKGECDKHANRVAGLGDIDTVDMDGKVTLDKAGNIESAPSGAGDDRISKMSSA